MTVDIEQIAPHTGRRLLDACGLPTADLEDPAIMLFGAFADDALVGVIGLQRCDDVGLLRSLAVQPASRDRGIARRLIDRVIAQAQRDGLESLWLLTTDAADYFARHGFVGVPRDAAHPAIRATAQFTSLCSSTAQVMRAR